MKKLKKVLAQYEKAIIDYEKARKSLIKELAEVDDLRKNIALDELRRKIK